MTVSEKIRPIRSAKPDSVAILTDEQILSLCCAGVRHTVQNVRVDPRTAKALLDLNHTNRPLSQRHVMNLAREMKAGRWQRTHQGIAVGSNGELLDGQHRCHGVVESQTEIVADITFGLDPKMFTVIDTHRKREASDTLGLMGVISARNAASVLRTLWAIRTSLRGNQRLTASNDEIKEEFYKWPNFEDMMKQGNRIRHKLRGFGSGCIAGMFLIYRDAESHDDADAFFASVETGVGIGSIGDPALVLSRDCARTTKGRVSHESAAIVVKAWNAHRQGKELKLLGWRATEPFPKVLP